ncbi:MAG TPA: hypothetical protein VGE72_02980 [Azospirillum sp.]
MTLNIKKCLDDAVTAGRLSRELAEDALKLITKLERQYAAEMAPDQATAAAMAEASRIMKEAAERKKAQTARQILAVDRATREAEAHPDGVVAGAMALLTRDIRGKATYSNVEARREVVLGQLFRRFEKGLNAYRSKAAGLVQDTMGLRNLVRELFGESTNDATAKAAAGGWKDAADYAAKRFQAAGGDLVEREDWRLPQITDPARLKKFGREAWIDHMTQAAARGDLRVIDFDTGEAVDAMKLQNILATSWDNLTSPLAPPPGKGGSYGRHNERRVFHWQNAESWLAYNDQFGAGRGGLYDLLVGHMEAMARDIALTEVLGPKHGATIRHLQELAVKAAADGSAKTMGALESPAAIARTYDVVSGRLGTVQNEFVGALFGGLRNWMTATKLGGALISAVPSDTVMATWAAKANGIPAVKLLGQVVKQLNPASDADRAFALRLGIVSSAVQDAALGSKRFADEIVGEGITARLASFIVRAQGLSAWTNGMKNAFMLEFMGYIADNTGRSMDEVSKPLRRMLKRYGFSAADWDAIRAAPMIEHEGARFFDPGAVADRRLGERLMEAIIEERAFAVLEPDARVRQITTAGLQRGTVMGEVARSAMLFKSFAFTMITTHMLRAAQQETALGKLAYVGALTGLLTVAGAAAMQAKAIVAGKDPRRMDDQAFWGSAMLQGGALGIFGDFLSTGYTRGDRGFVATMAGPVLGGLTEDVARVTLPNVRQLYEGEPTRMGAELARLVRQNLPLTNLWYLRLVADRTIMDGIQVLADPEWRQSFARMERKARQDFQQKFWFGPQSKEWMSLGPLDIPIPRRAPDPGAIAP